MTYNAKITQGMEGVYNVVGRPGIYRNDRFWLAGDHRVEPELYDIPKVRALIDASERAKEEFKMTEFQGFNVCYCLFVSSLLYFCSGRGVQGKPGIWC